MFLDGKNCDKIKTKLDAVYGDISPSMTTVKFWFNEFKCGRTSVFDEDQPRRLAEVVTEDIVKKVRKIILADHRTKVCVIAESVGVSTGTAINLLHDRLAMKKLSFRWVPRLSPRRTSERVC